VDALDLLFRRIVLAAHAAGALERHLTVGELLDQFAPYAAARRDGALDTHDDYLHALMRLISGERARFFGDDLMQDDLKAELETPNPDLTVLRTYAQTKLRISTAGVQEILAGDTTIDLRPPTPGNTPRASGARARQQTGEPMTLPRGPIAEPMTEPRPSGAIQQAFEAYASSLSAAAEEGLAAAQAAGPSAVTVEAGCPYCAQALPKGRTVKFCPSCGLNLLARRCPGCSAEIEQGWKFCVTCGRKA
jgi:Double zinc ribbon